jgi:hypothetical protein
MIFFCKKKSTVLNVLSGSLYKLTLHFFMSLEGDQKETHKMAIKNESNKKLNKTTKLSN